MNSDKQSKPDGNLPCPDHQVGSSDHDIVILLPSAEAYSVSPLKASHPSDNPFLNRLLEILDKYRDLGEIVFPNGTMSIGKIPGKEKWFLCHIYGKLNLEQIKELSSWSKTDIPSHLKKFYAICNGMTLFSGHFGIYGFRGQAPDNMPNYQPTPFFTAQRNAYLAVINAPHDAIFIGGCYFGYGFYLTPRAETVYAYKSPDATSIEQWPTIEAMVLDVAERLSRWFDENAQPIGLVNEKSVLFEPN